MNQSTAQIRDGSPDEGEQFKLPETQSQGLTNWAKEPSLQDLKYDYESARNSHRVFVENLDRWNDLRDVKGKYAPKKRTGRSAVQPKLIRRQAEWRYPALTEPFNSSNKLFQVRPVTFEDAAAARQNEIVLNWQFRTKINRVKFIDDYIRSGVDEGTVFVRVGWKRVTKKVTEEVKVFTHYAIDPELSPEDAEALEEFQMAAQLKLDNPREFDETATEEMKAAVELFEETAEATIAVHEGKFESVETEEVIENRPEVTVFNPKNVMVDPSCEGDLDKAKFAILSFETCKADLQKEGLYKNLDKIVWNDVTPATEHEHSTTTPEEFNFRDPERRRVVAYEYWGFHDIDGSGELVPIVATWVGSTIIRMEKNPFPDQKIPLVVATYIPVKRELTGEPDAELLEENQAVLGALMRGMIDLLGRSANSQQAWAKGSLDPMNRRRFQEGEDYEFNPQSHPQNAYMQHKYPELPQSALIMANSQNNEAEALTGVKSFSGGMSGEAYGEVAAGIRGVLDAASKRELSILRRFAQGIIDIGKKIISMNQVFLSEEEVIRVTNEEFVTIRREDLQGNFDLETDITTAEMEEQKTQDLAFMLQTMGPNMPMELSGKLLAEIADRKRMPDLAQEIRNFRPEPDPLEQKIKELEIARLEREIAKLESETVENYADAKKKESEAIRNQVDAIEQETGTKHARDLEMSKAQARGNQDLQVTKALTTPRKEGERDPDVTAAIGFNEITDRKDDAAGRSIWP